MWIVVQVVVKTLAIVAVVQNRTGKRSMSCIVDFAVRADVGGDGSESGLNGG